MKNLCKSYTLNVAALVALISQFYFVKDYFVMIKYFSEGGGDFLVFYLLPRSLVFTCLVILSLLLETCFYLLQLNFAFNFPCEKIPNKTIYHILFYFGLIWGLLPILLMLISSCLG